MLDSVSRGSCGEHSLFSADGRPPWLGLCSIVSERALYNTIRTWYHTFCLSPSWYATFCLRVVGAVLMGIGLAAVTGLLRRIAQ